MSRITVTAYFCSRQPFKADIITVFNPSDRSRVAFPLTIDAIIFQRSDIIECVSFEFLADHRSPRRKKFPRRKRNGTFTFPRNLASKIDRASATAAGKINLGLTLGISVDKPRAPRQSCANVGNRDESLPLTDNRPLSPRGSNKTARSWYSARDPAWKSLRLRLIVDVICCRR